MMQTHWDRILLEEREGKAPSFWDFGNTPVIRSATVEGDHIGHNPVIVEHCLNYADDWQVVIVGMDDAPYGFSFTAEDDISFAPTPRDFLEVLRTIETDGLERFHENSEDVEGVELPRPKAILLSIDNLPRILEEAGRLASEINKHLKELTRLGRSLGVYISLTEDARIAA